MKPGKFTYFLVVYLFLSASAVHADSPVWKIVKDNHQLFIGGTIHVLTKSDYPLPSTFEKAYRQATELVFETDIQKMQSPEFQKTLQSKIAYTDGRNLKMVLNETTFKELESYLAGRGIPIAGMLNFKPGIVVATLTVIELQRLGLVGAGVDKFFLLRAINDQKKIGQLETVDEQLAFIVDMGKGREDELIRYTLRDLNQLPDLMQSIKEAWRHGDNQKLKEIALIPIKKDFPEVYDELIVKRNNAWMPKIEAMLKTKQVEFILVGALHLAGEDGVLAKLASQGYSIQKP